MRKKIAVLLCTGLVMTGAVTGCAQKTAETAPATTEATTTAMSTEAATTTAGTTEKAADDKSENATYKNLQAAVVGETGASSSYAVYATAAEKEGNTTIARLFQATSAAEKIHLDKEYAIANAMIPYDQPEAKEVTPGTSIENLKAGIKGETYEVDTMYPDFLKVALEENQTESSMIFQYALAAEATHAEMYTQELAILEEKGTYADDSVMYYICPICGKIEKGNPSQVCTVCGAAGSTFMEF